MSRFMQEEVEGLQAQFKDTSPEKVIEWALQRFGDKIAFAYMGAK